MLGGSKSSGEILDTRPSEPHSIVGVLVGWKLPLVHLGACFIASEGPGHSVWSCLGAANHYSGSTSPHQGMAATRNHIWGRWSDHGSESGPSPNPDTSLLMHLPVGTGSTSTSLAAPVIYDYLAPMSFSPLPRLVVGLHQEHNI